jgi:hypothetical protein
MGINSLHVESRVRIVLGEHSFDERSGLSSLIPRLVGRVRSLAGRCAILRGHRSQGASIKSKEFASSIVLSENKFERCCSTQYSAGLQLLNGTPHMNAMILFYLFSTIFHPLPRLASHCMLFLAFPPNGDLSASFTLFTASVRVSWAYLLCRCCVTSVAASE